MSRKALMTILIAGACVGVVALLILSATAALLWYPREPLSVTHASFFDPFGASYERGEVKQKIHGHYVEVTGVIEVDPLKNSGLISALSDRHMMIIEDNPAAWAGHRINGRTTPVGFEDIVFYSDDVGSVRPAYEEALGRKRFLKGKVTGWADWSGEYATIEKAKITVLPHP